MQQLLDQFGNIQKAYTSVKLENATISKFIPYFNKDYFMYWGEIKTAKKNHQILWIVCRTPIGISAEQVNLFSVLLTSIRFFKEMHKSNF